MSFNDLNDNPIQSYSGMMLPDSEAIYPFRVDCFDGWFLTCEPVEEATIEGRFFGDLVWVNLESSFLDLTPFAGTRKQIEVRVTTGSDQVRFNARLKISP